MNAWKQFLGLLVRAAGIKAVGFPGTGTYNTRDHQFVEYTAGAPTYSGKQVTAETALNVATAFACVRVLAETVGTLSCDVYERKGNGDFIPASDHPLANIFRVSPNADMTSVELKEAIITNLALGGNQFSYRSSTSRGQLTSLYPIPSCNVKLSMAKGGGLAYSVWEDGKWEDYPAEKIFHVRGFGSSGLIGFSPIACARQTFGVSLATEEFQARFFSQGANPSWIVSVPVWFEKDKREIARENIKNIWTGPDNSHKVALLEGGMTATAATMPLHDAQFLELRKFSRDEICGIFRVPPHLVGNLERSTNNNIEHQSLELVMYTIAPYLARVESAATKWLFMPEERSRFVLRFNVDSLLRADAATRAELHSKYVQNGIMTRNEVRAIERLPRSTEAGMDSHTVQVNLTPVEQLEQLAMSNAVAKKPAAAVPPVKALIEALMEAGYGPRAETQAAPTLVMNLPDSFKHELLQRIELAGIDKLVEQMKKISQRHDADAAEFRKEARAVVEMAKRLESGADRSSAQLVSALERLTDAYTAPRKSTLSDGTVIHSQVSH